jgi:hypothetical protein
MKERKETQNIEMNKKKKLEERKIYKTGKEYRKWEINRKKRKEKTCKERIIKTVIMKCLYGRVN